MGKIFLLHEKEKREVSAIASSFPLLPHLPYLDGMAHHDIPEGWIVMMRPSLLVSGCWVSPSRLVPALQLSEFARSGGLSEVFGAGVMLRKLFVAPLSAEAQSCQRIFQPCQVRAARAHRRCTRISRGELCGDPWPWGAGSVSFLRDLGMASSPPWVSQ